MEMAEVIGTVRTTAVSVKVSNGYGSGKKYE